MPAESGAGADPAALFLKEGKSMEYRMNRSLSTSYRLAGVVFLVAAVLLWVYSGLELMGDDSLRLLCRIGAVVVAVLAVVSLLRPARACVRLEDDDTLRCCDGYGPAKRVATGDIARVDLLGGRRMALYLKNGKRINLEFLFEGREIFLAELRSRGIPVESPAQR